MDRRGARFVRRQTCGFSAIISEEQYLKHQQTSEVETPADILLICIFDELDRAMSHAHEVHEVHDSEGSWPPEHCNSSQFIQGHLQRHPVQGFAACRAKITARHTHTQGSWPPAASRVRHNDACHAVKCPCAVQNRQKLMRQKLMQERLHLLLTKFEFRRQTSENVKVPAARSPSSAHIYDRHMATLPCGAVFVLRDMCASGVNVVVWCSAVTRRVRAAQRRLVTD